MAESRLTFKVPELKGLRDERGRFVTAGPSEQFARNRRLAEILRADVGRRIQNHVAFGKRADQSSGRLVRASSDPRNSQFDGWHVGVGIPAWLDRSQARYWRTFEEGSAAVWKRPFVGTQLFPSRRGRTSANLITVTEPRPDGRFVVGHEIAPANIYDDVWHAHKDELRQEGIYAARRFLDGVFREDNLRIAGPPR